MGLSKKTKLIVSLALTISLTSVLTIGCNNGVSQSNNNKTQEASNDSTSILNEIENDHSITDEDKNTIVKEVLNGRWFSSRLDSYFNN